MKVNIFILTKVTAYITRDKDGTRQILVFEEKGFEHLGFQKGSLIKRNRSNSWKI